MKGMEAVLPADQADALVSDWVRDALHPPPRIIAPPSEPMPVARALVDALYSDGSGPLLRDHVGDFYRYDGVCWPEVDLRVVRAAAYEWLENAKYEKRTREGVQLEAWAPTRNKVANVLEALRAVLLLDADETPLWDPPTLLGAPPAAETVSMANGLLHVPTRTLYDHTPSFFTHHSLPFGFDPAAPAATRWLNFLAELWPDDHSAIAALQEVFGYIMGGDTRHQKIFLFVGPRRGGKGTIGRVLTGLLGAHNVAAPTMASLGTNFGLQPLIGRPLGLISDARLSGRGDGSVVVERLLSVSGEDCLTIDRKYREPWTGRLPARFVILTNELPRLADSSGALASRFIVFVLTKSFLGREDPLLTDRLLAEAPGIFNWALAGLDRLNQRGHFAPPDSGRDAVRELEDLSSPVSAFVRERCELGAARSIAVDELWRGWKLWCEDDNRHPGTKAVFGRNLKATAPSTRKARLRDDGDREHHYVGIGFSDAGNTMAGHRDHRDQDARPPERSPAWSRHRPPQEGA